ncbi:MAG: hypothetical protein Q7R57_08395 [Dehalococcoidales bacterium]|nr:hypothetical protein [Dehalococcoidales bacterium]
MDKAITTALLIVAGVVCMIFVFNSVYPMLNRSSAAMTSMADSVDDRMKSRVSIVHATGTAARTTVYFWVKNVGSTRIVSIDQSDVFLGQTTNYARIPYVADAGGNYPMWVYSIVNDTEWKNSATIMITVIFTSDPGAGTYYIKLVLPNGISDEYFFSM